LVLELAERGDFLLEPSLLVRIGRHEVARQVRDDRIRRHALKFTTRRISLEPESITCCRSVESASVQSEREECEQLSSANAATR
jgi:hypothetical protein